jgi:hypothetical protein
MNIPNEQKLLLLCALGYTVKSGDIQGLSKAAAERKLLSYIMKLSGVSKANKETLAKMCGFSVKNGRIVLKA